jgi:PIN domain nuclease of toxin-antitoxin system
MKLLLDTHAYLWWTDDDPRLSVTARAAMSDPSNEIYVSSITAVELAIKLSLAKLKLPLPLDAFLASTMAAAGFEELPLLAKHAVERNALAHHHRDPFDRLLISQAVVEQMHLVTNDAQIIRYAVNVLW